MYIHLTPDRTKAFAGLYPKDSGGIGPAWINWPVVESACLVVWVDATSYNQEIKDMIEAFGPQAEGIPHELIYPV